MTTDTENEMPQAAAVPPWAGSQAVKAGPTIYVSALMGVRKDGTLVSDVNLARQIDAVYANLRDALGEFGASLDDVVSETVFLTDIEQPYVAQLVGRAYSGRKALPARTFCQVEKLLVPNAMIAIACVAYLDPA